MFLLSSSGDSGLRRLTACTHGDPRLGYNCLQQELTVPQSLADACQPSQDLLTLASVSDEEGSPTALTQATPDILTPFLGLMFLCPLTGQHFTCTGLFGEEAISGDDGPGSSGCGNPMSINWLLPLGSAFESLRSRSSTPETWPLAAPLPW